MPPGRCKPIRSGGSSEEDGRGSAAELAELVKKVGSLFSENHFGECVEATHALFHDVVQAWVADLREQSETAQTLADACFVAGKTLSDADSDAASNIGPF